MEHLFNGEELLERVDRDLDFLAVTVDMLETDGRSLMAAVKAGATAADGPAVGKAAHTLKGMISNFCAPEVVAKAQEVEKAGKVDDYNAAAAAAQRLEIRLEELIGELRLFLKARSSCGS